MLLYNFQHYNTKIVHPTHELCYFSDNNAPTDRALSCTSISDDTLIHSLQLRKHLKTIIKKCNNHKVGLFIEIIVLFGVNGTVFH